MTEPPRPWSPSWATIADHPCVTVTCSHCGEALDSDGEGGIAHFDDVAEALKNALDLGFVQDGDRLLCKSCAGEIVCGRDGHRWKHHHSNAYTGYNARLVPAHDYWDCKVCEESIDVDPGVTPGPGQDHPTLLDVSEAGEPA